MTKVQEQQMESFYGAACMTALDLGMEMMRCPHVEETIAIAVLASAQKPNASVFLTCKACLAPLKSGV